jgi:hypothetical protein
MGKMTISIASSENCHFSSLARKKSKGEGTISDFFKGFFQCSLGKIQRFLGNNLGTVATSCAVSCYRGTHAMRNELRDVEKMTCHAGLKAFYPR